MVLSGYQKLYAAKNMCGWVFQLSGVFLRRPNTTIESIYRVLFNTNSSLRCDWTQHLLRTRPLTCFFSSLAESKEYHPKSKPSKSPGLKRSRPIMRTKSIMDCNPQTNTHMTYMYQHLPGVLFGSKGWCMGTSYHPFSTLWKIQVYNIYI